MQTIYSVHVPTKLLAQHTWSLALLHLSSYGSGHDTHPLPQLHLTISSQWVEHFIIVCQDVESIRLVSGVLGRRREGGREVREGGREGGEGRKEGGHEEGT